MRSTIIVNERCAVFGPGALVSVCLAIGLQPVPSAMAASYFPAEQRLVPFIVVAAFVMPAICAGGYSLLRLALSRAGPMVSLAAMVIMAIALAVYMEPSLPSRFGLQL